MPADLIVKGSYYSPGPTLVDMALIADGGGHSWTTGATATTGGQIGALRLRACINFIDGVQGAGSGVMLPRLVGGQLIYIFNRSGSDITIWVAVNTNDTIIGAGVSETLVAGTSRAYLSVADGWIEWLETSAGADGPFLPLSGGTMLGPLNVTATGSTTSRSAQDRFAETINVKDYGAKGDGATDDTAAIQAALNAAASTGGQVTIGRWRYYINGAVTLPLNVGLLGELRTIGANASQDWYAFGSQLKLGPSGSITAAGGNVIERVMFIRAGLYTTLPANATDAAAVVANFVGTGLSMPNTADTYVSSCMFLGFNTGIDATGCSRINVMDCRFDCNNGIFSSNSTDVSRYHRNHFWPFMTMLIPGVGNTPLAYLPLQRPGYAHKAENDQWNQYVDCFQYGYNQGWWSDNCSNPTYIGCHADYTNPTTNSVAGFQFTGTTGVFSDAKMIGCFGVSQNINVLLNGTGGPLDPCLEIVGGNLVGQVNCVNVVAGRLLVTGATFEVAPTAINFGAGTLGGSVVGCGFNGMSAASIAFANASVQASVVVLGNTVSRGAPVTNEQTLAGLTVPQMVVSNATGVWETRNTAGPADQKNSDIFQDSSGNISYRLVNDAYSAVNTWMSVTRTGYAPQQVTITAPTIALSGAVSASGNSTFAQNLFINTTGQGTDQNRWGFLTGSGGTFTGYAWNDALSANASWLSVTRSGYVPQQITLTAPAIVNAGATFISSGSGATIRSGTGVASGSWPAGSLWLRTDGSAGARLYVSAGGGTWAAVAGV